MDSIAQSVKPSKGFTLESAAVNFCNLRSLFTAMFILAGDGDKYEADILNLAELGKDVADCYANECFKASGANEVAGDE